MCSGSVVVTAYDFESGCPSSNPEWGSPEPSSLRGSTLGISEQLNIKAVTGACKLIDGCSLELCLATPSVASSGKCHKVNSIAWLYRDGLAMR